MLSNFHKKESPIQGFAGFGGGIARLGFSGGGGPVAFIRSSTWQGAYYDNEQNAVFDSSGNVYWTYSVKQSYNGNNGYQEDQGFVEKIDSFGNIVWTKKYWGNGSQTSTYERAAFSAIDINSNESNIALTSQWYDSNNSTFRNVILVLDTQTGNMVNSDVEYFSWTFLNSKKPRLRYDYTNKDRLQVSFQDIWGNYQYWITGSNKSSNPIVSFDRSDNYANQQPIITNMYNIAETGGSSTNDYEIFARIRQSSTSGRYISAYYSYTNNGTTPQAAYYYNGYWYGSWGGMIAGNRSSYQYIVYADYVNNQDEVRITLTSQYSHAWTRSSGAYSGSKFKASSVRVAYDHTNDKIYALFFELGAGTSPLYRSMMVAELSNSDGSVVQAKLFYAKTLGGSQSNPSTLSIDSTIQHRSNFSCDGEFLYISAYSDGYGATSHVLLKLPTDFSLLSDGEVVVSSKFSVVFSSPTISDFVWATETGSTLTQDTNYSSSTATANTLSTWGGQAVDNSQDIGVNHVVGIENL